MDDGASPKSTYVEKNNWFSDFFKKLNRKNADKITEQEIISMVNEGQETGVLQANEVEMIQNIFEFTDKEAKDIMTHRSNICALDGTINLQEALDRVLVEPYSRFPVYLDDIDNIIGILHIKEIMAFSRKEVMELLKEVNEKTGKTLVVITHDERIASAASRQFSIVDGRLREAGER